MVDRKLSGFQGGISLLKSGSGKLRERSAGHRHRLPKNPVFALVASD